MRPWYNEKILSPCKIWLATEANRPSQFLWRKYLFKWLVGVQGMNNNGLKNRENSRKACLEFCKAWVFVPSLPIIVIFVFSEHQPWAHLLAKCSCRVSGFTDLAVQLHNESVVVHKWTYWWSTRNSVGSWSCLPTFRSYNIICGSPE